MKQPMVGGSCTMCCICTYQSLCSSWFFVQVYEDLYQSMITGPGALEKAEWWKDIANRPKRGSLHHEISKL